MAARRLQRQKAERGQKRSLILSAAREVFLEEGLEGASVRAIAARAGYAPAALYFHFDSKEAIYAEVLQGSLETLGGEVEQAAGSVEGAGEKLRAGALAFFRFYARNPRDLDLGFYLLRGGMKPNGLGRERDEALNAALSAALNPMAKAAVYLGVDPRTAELLVVDIFAHATGLLLLLHTGRIRMFGASAAERMQIYIDERIACFERGAH
ncbi:TetR/AcrR family transcriptional regulator [Pararhodobacter sp. SW119]|uniref:TetR/AcrR family transcriptional regulator n=1 Tax=Pararhodobacter sp. SW119 TaxID=2780075 RepID=UPI001ADFFEDF|nr:TetR/AcrR family transcriptional regulator [Pararhodobacter sp. SW119]